MESSSALSKKYPASSVIPTGFSTSTSSTALCTLPFNSLQKSSTSHDKDDGVGIVLLKNDEAKEIPPEVQTRAKVQVTLPSESAIDLSLDSSEDEWHENSATYKRSHALELAAQSPNEIKKLSCAQPAESLYPKSRWLSKFEDLKNYKEIHGSFDVKQSINMSLYGWLAYQRQCFRNFKTGASPALSEVKIKLLQDEGVSLDKLENKDYENNEGVNEDKKRLSGVNMAHELKWIKQFDKLKAYKSKHGDCNVNSSTDVLLYQWASRQREQYKLYNEGKGCSITAERVKLLNGEGFVWETKNVTDRRRKSADNNVFTESPRKWTKKGNKRDDEKWLSMFEKLKKYREQHATFTVSKQLDQHLYRWKNTQKSLYKQVLNGDISKMFPERVSLLEKEGFEAIFEGASTSKQNLLSKRVAKYFFNINGERELFYGTVIAFYKSNGEDLFAIKYDDGETHIEGKDTVLELLDLYSSAGPSDGRPDIQNTQHDAVTPCNHMTSAIPISAEGVRTDSRKAEMEDGHEKVSLTFRSENDFLQLYTI